MRLSSSRCSAALFWVSCAALLRGGCSFAPGVSRRAGHPRGLAAAWAKKQTLGPALDALGLRRGASLDEAKAAYRARVRSVHPDRDPSPEAAERYQLFTESYEFVTRELGPGGGGSATGLGATIDFAASMFGFAQSVVADVAMPLAGAVANVAVDAAAPAWRTAAATASGVRNGRSWAAAKNDADAAEMAAKLEAAEARLAVANEALGVFDAEEWAQPQLDAAHAAQAVGAADAAAARAALDTARALLADARAAEAAVHAELASVREGLRAVEGSLRQHGCFDAARANVIPGEGEGGALEPVGELDDDADDAAQLEDELVALTGAAAALGARAKFWAWKAAAGFAPGCDRTTVEPVVAALRTVARDLDDATDQCEACAVRRAHAHAAQADALNDLAAAQAQQADAQRDAASWQAAVAAQAPARAALVAEAAAREKQRGLLAGAVADLKLQAPAAIAEAAAAVAAEAAEAAAEAAAAAEDAARQEKKARGRGFGRA